MTLIQPHFTAALAEAAPPRPAVDHESVRALAAAFPSVIGAMDEAAFQAQAKAFLANATPQTGPGFFGSGFADHLRAAHVAPWLADLASLDLAWRIAHHAADCPPLAPDAVTALSGTALAAARLRLHPAAVLVCCDWPVRRPSPGRPASIPAHPAMTHRLITRPDLAVRERAIDAETALLFTALAAGAPLGEATADLVDGLAALRDLTTLGAFAALDR